MDFSCLICLSRFMVPYQGSTHLRWCFGYKCMIIISNLKFTVLHLRPLIFDMILRFFLAMYE